MKPVYALTLLLACVLAAHAPAQTTLRVATFDLGDVRTPELLDGNTPRLRRLAEVVQRLRPNVLLVTGLAYDMPGAPGWREGGTEGRNASRFAENYLASPQAEGVEPLHLRPFAAPCNAGVPSGLDLDHDGTVTKAYPTTPGAAPSAAYAGDCWSPGAFPGQQAMALFVDERLTIDREHARTFRLLPWSYMDGAYLPEKPDHTPWFSPEALRVARLSAKSHWDVPVVLPGGAVLHLLCSAPAAPDPKDPLQRDARRQHDEIRLWCDYVQDTGGYIVDDASRAGGLPRASSFVILGPLGADPASTATFKEPFARLLASVKRINTTNVPAQPDASPATTRAGARLDFVLPSTDLGVKASGVWTSIPSGVDAFPGDRFPVWVDLVVPPAPAP